MTDQGEQTPERASFRDEAALVAGRVSGKTMAGQPIEDMVAIVESALRSAEARGRVQALREAADDAVNAPLPRFYLVRNDAVGIAAWLRERADAIEQEQPK